MDILVGILLYLAAIVSPGTYYDTELYEIRSHNEPQYSTVENDQQLVDQILIDYADDIDRVVVLEWDEP